MPIATPAAPYASAATRPRPSKKPPAAITGMSTASTTCGSSSVVGDRAGVAAALAALHDHRVDTPRRDLLGVAAGADRRHHARRPRPSALDLVLARARARTTRPAPARRRAAATRVVGVLGVGAQVHAERPVGARLHLADRGRELVEGHRRRREDAERARVRGRGDEPRARRPSPCRSARSARRCRTRSQIGVRSASRVRDFLLAAGRSGR